MEAQQGIAVSGRSSDCDYYYFNQEEMLNATLNCFSLESDTSSELATIQGVAGAVLPHGRLLAYVSRQGALGNGGRDGPSHLRLLHLESREDRLLVADRWEERRVGKECVRTVS